VSREPAIVELRSPPDPFEALRRFADVRPVLLESASRRPRLGRYSFLAADGFLLREERWPRYGADPLRPIAETMRSLAAPAVRGLPPFQGGVIGLLGYEAGAFWERLPAPRSEVMGVPAFRAELFDWVLAWDHEQNRAWIIARDLPAADGRGATRGHARAEWVRQRLAGPPRSSSAASGAAPGSVDSSPHFPLPDVPHVTSNFDRAAYIRAVERVVEYIRAGDVFQANLSQQLSSRTALTPVDLYGRLRAVNPAPFAAFYGGDDWAVVSASPERFLRVAEGVVETRPIKGTRRRSFDPVEDARLAAELLASEKDRAENVMIVDLLRNDLSRVCRPGTVAVPELCSLESYETVHHLVSSVSGTLEEGKDAWDLFAAAFPGGSITGAPKVRAMEIIHELEPTPRGPYCGSLFSVGFDGSADSNILIRTMVCRGDRVCIGAGGGVTAASDPEAEYEETLDKAAAMLHALG